MQKSPMELNIDIKATTPVLSQNGNQIFGMGVILRKLSKFITGSPEDTIIPIQVFYDLKTGQVLTELLPKELRDEFENKIQTEGSEVIPTNSEEKGETEKGKVVDFNSFPNKDKGTQN